MNICTDKPWAVSWAVEKPASEGWEPVGHFWGDDAEERARGCLAYWQDRDPNYRFRLVRLTREVVPGGGYIGENDGPRGSKASDEDVFKAWISAPPHRANIIRQDRPRRGWFW